MKPIGLFFGTFNPIHKGHLAVANYFVENTDLEEVWLVISPHNPFKNKAEILENTHRLEIVRLAVHNRPKLKACEVEFELPTPSYTFNTLQHLRHKHPNNSFVVLLGQDNLSHFDQWKNHQAILDKHKLYVYPRKGADPIPKPLREHPKIEFFNAPEIHLSATTIRQKIQNDENVSSLLIPNTLHYIQSQKLYR